MSDRKGIEIMIFITTAILPILPSLNHQPNNISYLMLRHPTQPFVGGSGAFALQ
jgi:hypothetical protein